jgi:ribose transport system permease protein
MATNPDIVTPTPPTPAANTQRRRLEAIGRLIGERPGFALVVVLALLLGFGQIATSGFLSAGQLSNMLLSAAPLALLAAGQTLVMLTGGIDLSVSTTATAAAYIMAGQGSHGTVTAILVGLAVGLIIGLVNGIGVGVFRVQPLIMTLGVSAILVGVLTINAQNFINGVPLVPSAIQTLGAGRQLSYIPNNLIVWIPIALLIILGLRASGFGRVIYAIGDNGIAAELAGVRTWQPLILVYTLCGLLSAIGGILLVGYTNAADLGLADPYLLPSIAAVVIGGTSIFGGRGGYGGTILGALILTVLDNVLVVLNASEAIKQMIYGAIVVLLGAFYVRASRQAVD